MSWGVLLAGTARFCHRRVASPRKFAKRSFRTVVRGTRRVVVGCPRGKWSKGRCKVGMRAQAILIPVPDNGCCPRKYKLPGGHRCT